MKNLKIADKIVLILIALFTFLAIASLSTSFILFINYKHENTILEKYVTEALSNIPSDSDDLRKAEAIFKWIRKKLIVRKHDNSANYGLRMTPLQVVEQGGLCSDYTRLYVVLGKIAGLHCSRLYLYRTSDILDKKNNPSFHVVPVVTLKNRTCICPDAFEGELYVYKDNKVFTPSPDSKNYPLPGIPPGKYSGATAYKFNWVKIPVIFPTIYKFLLNFNSPLIESLEMPLFTGRPNLFGSIIFFLVSICNNFFSCII